MPEIDVEPGAKVTRIRDELRSLIGAKIVIKANLGRCRFIQKEATVEETHPNLFVLRIHADAEQARRISYSYADVITRTVELSNPDTGEEILNLG